jgi:hypothetical protein
MARVQVALKDLAVLKEILAEMGMKTVDKQGTIQAMDGKTEAVVAQVEGTNIGVRATTDANGTSYSLVGEFYRTKWYGKEKALADKINQTYAVKKTKKEFTAMGYIVQGTEKVSADGTIELTMAKY